jgi:hypothetical protein
MPIIEISIDELVKWGTFAGAIVAGLTGIYTLYLKHRDESQWLRVGLGPFPPNVDPSTEMHVINCGLRKAALTDYGFIYNEAKLLSAPIEHDIDPHSWGGNYLFVLDHLQTICVGFQGGRKSKIIGAYARSATNGKWWLTFSDDLPRWKRVWYRIYIRWNKYD